MKINITLIHIDKLQNEPFLYLIFKSLISVCLTLT